jgi:flagellar biosynthesis protein FlhF
MINSCGQPMQVVQFVTDDAASVIQQIHGRLGPEAVVLSVRRLPPQGVARIWQRRGRIEVVAGVPDRSPFPEPGQGLCGGSPPAAFPTDLLEERRPPVASSAPADGWRTVAWLESLGLLPACARRLQQRLDIRHPARPASAEAEWEAVRAELTALWFPSRTWPPVGAPQTHVFIGPPGSGKTTALCKWLTLAVLTEGRSASVWRLDSNIANTAEFLTMHCEMLDTPVERLWSAPGEGVDLAFVDLPGLDPDDAQALASMRAQLAELPPPRIHLVLNAAYETDALLAQWRAFAPLNPNDLIFTHLDEEPRRMKLWNLVLGANCAISFLSAGQKIPGDFRTAVPELLFPTQNRP